MKPRTAFFKWGAIGVVVASILLLGQSNAMGGLAGILQVADTSPLREVIETELGAVPTHPVLGHDSQLYYGVGLDPLGESVPELIDNAGYRYRRILYPMTASLFGLLDGYGLLWAMIGLTVASVAFSAGAVGFLSVRFGMSDWLALVVILNPGVWLGVRLITTEPMAIALMLGGLWLFVDQRKSAVAAFAAMALTKEMFLITPAGLAVRRPNQRWRIVVIPALALLVWMVWLNFRMGDGSAGGPIGLPLQGIFEAVGFWGETGSMDLFYLIFALSSVLGGLVYSLLLKTWLRWSILGWSLLGIVSSHFVWDIGNNAARVFGPIVILVALAEAVRRSAGAHGVLGTERVESAD